MSRGSEILHVYILLTLTVTLRAIANLDRALRELIYIYIYIYNCRQYLGLISAVLMSRMEVKL